MKKRTRKSNPRPLSPAQLPHSQSHPVRGDGLAIPDSKSLIPIRFLSLAVTLLAAVMNINLWTKLLQGVRPRAWDGTGHFALAQIYDQTIFPNTFGWTNAYFAGMPFPNFYPPLFYWCIAFLHHTPFFSFPAAFNLLLGLPTLLLPIVIWRLAKSVSDNDRVVVIFAALASIPLLTDIRFEQFGLSYPSTFLIGLYTQPLGFVLLVLWYIVYINSPRNVWRVALASLLLALTVLANFFNAVTCAFFIAAVILNDLKAGSRRFSKEPSPQARRDLAAHLISPLIALLLTLFWLIPILSDYAYLVTRPQTMTLKEILSTPNIIWYLLSIIGILRWRRHRSIAMRPFLWACLGLACAVFFSTIISPRWFPFQAPRFIGTLNFLLAVPVGHAMAALFAVPKILFGTAGLWPQIKIWLLRITRSGDKNKRGGKARLRAWLLRKSTVRLPLAQFLSSFYVKAASTMVLIIASFFLLERPAYDIAFYTPSSQQSLQDILHFAEEHREGRYLVEIPVASSDEAAFEGRALNSYLGAQGNETVSVVFREASPNSIFFNAVANTLSAYPDNFGISSVLAEDLDFQNQPLAKHLERACLIGTRYLVIFTPWMKMHLAEENGIKRRFESGDWTIFEL